MKRDFVLAVKSVIIKDDEVLLLHRSPKEMESSTVNRMDAWDLPGGGVQFFETMEKALNREIKEETGLEVDIKKVIGSYDAIRVQLHIAIITYLCEYKSGEVILSDEHDSYHWLKFDEIIDFNMPKWLKKYFITAIEEYKKINKKSIDKCEML